jgi:hypothetical protein
MPRVAVKAHCDIAIAFSRDDQPQEIVRAVMFLDDVHGQLTT